MTSAVFLESLSRRFGSVTALDNVSLDIAEGEFFALLGPSGSGKTTCLRLIAGFEKPDTGRVSLFGKDVSAVPPYKRVVNTVFQDYALFPHMRVLDNVAYGLKIRGVARAERYAEAEVALEQVRLTGYSARKPSELSGGQRQRVALARALINKPQVLLLDEPLGALDLKLREQMQEELKALQHKLGITFIFVTHDQGEALSMADRIAIFNEGSVIQVGSPRQIYEQPVSRFVADFVGSSNVLPPEFVTKVSKQSRWASLRPEHIQIHHSEQSSPGHTATVTGISYLGSSQKLSLRLYDQDLTCLISTKQAAPEIGATVAINWDPSALHLMPDP